jgi:hypothetical protein
MKPAAYIVRQKGLTEYTEVHMKKKDAEECARDMKCWPGTITITPLYAGERILVRRRSKS